MRTYCTAQGTLLNTLQWSIWEKNLKKINLELAELLDNQDCKKDRHVTKCDGKKALGQDLCPWKESKRRRKTVRENLTLSSEQVKPQTGHPSPGVLHRCWENKPPWLLGGSLGQIGRRNLDATHKECASASLMTS